MNQELLNKIDQVYDQANTSLLELFEDVDFELVSEFYAEYEVPFDHKELNYSGVYFIEIRIDDLSVLYQDWIKDFKVKWEDEKFLKKFTPNTKKKRIEKHTVLREWMPLYIGKSKKIGDRVNGHIFQPLRKSTFALKLLARDNLNNPLYRLSTIRIPAKNYDLIVPQIEKALRDKYNPLVGKQ